MIRLFHALVLGCIGAGIIHIIVLLLVPVYSQRDAWAVLSEQANLHRTVRLDPPDALPLIGSLDPLFDAVACRFDLHEGVLQLRGDGGVPYWSISIHDRAGLNIFSANDSSSPAGNLNFVVATPAQMISLRNSLPQELDGAVFVEAEINEGIALIRAFVPDPGWAPYISTWLRNIGCNPH